MTQCGLCNEPFNCSSSCNDHGGQSIKWVKYMNKGILKGINTLPDIKLGYCLCSMCYAKVITKLCKLNYYFGSSFFEQYKECFNIQKATLQSLIVASEI